MECLLPSNLHTYQPSNFLTYQPSNFYFDILRI